MQALQTLNGNFDFDFIQTSQPAVEKTSEGNEKSFLSLVREHQETVDETPQKLSSGDNVEKTVSLEKAEPEDKEYKINDRHPDTEKKINKTSHLYSRLKLENSVKAQCCVYERSSDPSLEITCSPLRLCL